MSICQRTDIASTAAISAPALDPAQVIEIDPRRKMGPGGYSLDRYTRHNGPLGLITRKVSTSAARRRGARISLTVDKAA